VTQVHILSERPVNQNTRAFLSPIIWNSKRICDLGISTKLFLEPTPEIYQCNILAVSGKFRSATNQKQRNVAVEWLSEAREKTERLVYFDRSSTAGHVTLKILSVVDAYFKTVLFRDRKTYQRRLYGSRLFCDFYHREFGIEDEQPSYSTAITDVNLADKLQLSWNTSLANYSILGP